MQTITNNFDLSSVREYTVEAGRPDTITKEKLLAIKSGGATRISINPQTLNDDVLVSIGRKHTVEQFYKAFEIARKVGFKCINTDIIAGLTSDTVDSFKNTLDLTVEDERVIKYLKRFGRPLINTEWLARCTGNTVQNNFPLFYLENIGCYNWGFVAGKYQTYEPWEGTWEAYYNGGNRNVDFTKWFHDLYRPNHRPYDPREIELIKEFCALADKDYAARATDDQQGE